MISTHREHGRRMGVMAAVAAIVIVAGSTEALAQNGKNSSKGSGGRSSAPAASRQSAAPKADRSMRQSAQQQQRASQQANRQAQQQSKVDQRLSRQAVANNRSLSSPSPSPAPAPAPKVRMNQPRASIERTPTASRPAPRAPVPLASRQRDARPAPAPSSAVPLASVRREAPSVERQQQQRDARTLERAVRQNQAEQKKVADRAARDGREQARIDDRLSRQAVQNNASLMRPQSLDRRPGSDDQSRRDWDRSGGQQWDGRGRDDRGSNNWHGGGRGGSGSNHWDRGHNNNNRHNGKRVKIVNKNYFNHGPSWGWSGWNSCSSGVGVSLGFWSSSSSHVGVSFSNNWCWGPSRWSSWSNSCWPHSHWNNCWWRRPVCVSSFHRPHFVYCPPTWGWGWSSPPRTVIFFSSSSDAVGVGTTSGVDYGYYSDSVASSFDFGDDQWAAYEDDDAYFDGDIAQADDRWLLERALRGEDEALGPPASAAGDDWQVYGGSPSPTAQMERGGQAYSAPSGDVIDQTKPDRTRDGFGSGTASGPSPVGAWRDLSTGNAERALLQFAELTQAEPDRSGPKVGYALAAAAVGRDDTAAWAMRRAFVSRDVDAIGFLADPQGLRPLLDQVAQQWSSRPASTSALSESDRWFMVAAVEYLRHNEGAAREALERSVAGGSVPPSAANLRRLLD